MRKIYYSLVTIVLCMMGLTANALDVKVNIDNAANVTVKVNNEVVSIHNGENIFSVSDPFNTGFYQSISISPNDGCYLKVTKTLNGATTETSSSISVKKGEEAAVYDVISRTEADRTGVCRVTVDDPALLKADAHGTSNQSYTFSQQTTEIRYIPGFDQIQFKHAVSGKVLYSVSVDGNMLNRTYNTFYVSLNEASVNVDVKVNAPAGLTRKVMLSYADPAAAEGFITAVKVEGEDVAKEKYLAAAGFDVPWGSMVTVYGNIQKYKFNKMTVNGGQTDYFAGHYSFNAIDDMTMVIDAELYAEIKATLTIDDVDNVLVTQFDTQSYSEIPLEGLSSGRNTIELSEKQSTITIKGSQYGTVVSVTANGVAQSEASPGAGYSIDVKDGMTIVVRTKKYVRDQTLIVYVDDISNVNYYSFRSGDYDNYRDVRVGNGYNEVKFYEGEVFHVSFANLAEEPAFMYVNNSLQPGNQVIPRNKDVLKIYSTGDKSVVSVDFVLEDIEVNEFSVVYDKVKEADKEDKEDGFYVLPGAEVVVMPIPSVKIKVAVDGNEITANEAGQFVFVVNEAVEVKVTKVGDAAINNVEAEQAGDGKIFNAMGVEVKTMSRGLYIVNGKKVVVNPIR